MLDILRNKLSNAVDKNFQPERYFKSQHKDNNCFINVRMPRLREIIKESELTFENKDVLQKLLESKINEERMLALLFLVKFYPKNQVAVYDFYVHNLDYVNNWNLVDASAHLIIGKRLLEDNFVTKDIVKFSNSSNLWHRRVSVVSMWWPIRKDAKEHYDLLLEIATKLMSDEEDLVCKAIGWMIRELGAKNEELMMQFLNKNKEKMSRITLRNILEAFPVSERAKYLIK